MITIQLHMNRMNGGKGIQGIELDDLNQIVFPLRLEYVVYGLFVKNINDKFVLHLKFRI